MNLAFWRSGDEKYKLIEKRDVGYHLSGDSPLDYSTLLRARMTTREGQIYLYRIAEEVQDVKRSLLALRRNVFRRGIEVSTESDGRKLQILNLLRMKNRWGQNTVDVLEELEDDVNTVDDAFLYLPIVVGSTRTQAPIRLDPCSTSFILTDNALGGVWICPACRAESCDCRLGKAEAIYETDFNGSKLKLFDEEVLHFSRYSPSKLYGRSPILTVLDEALAINGAAKALYQTFYKNKLPRGAVVVTTPDTEGFKAERREIRERLKDDPAYVPWLVLKNGQGQLGSQTSDLKFVQFGADLMDERSLKILKMLGERISSLYGVTAQEGSDFAVTRMSDDLTQSRFIEDAQRAYNERVFPFLLNRWGIDGVELKLSLPEEFLEKQRLERLNRKSIIAARLYQMGITVTATNDDITWDGVSVAGQNVSISDSENSDMLESGNISVSEGGRVTNEPI